MGNTQIAQIYVQIILSGVLWPVYHVENRFDISLCEEQVTYFEHFLRLEQFIWKLI